jgi:amino acid adenylation domain-containing protein
MNTAVADQDAHILRQKIAERHWMELLKGARPESLFRLSGPARQGSWSCTLDKQVLQQLNKVCRNDPKGKFVYFLTAMQAAYWKYTGSEEVLLAFPAIANAPGAGSPCFIRKQLQTTGTVREAIQANAKALMEACSHAGYDFSELQDKLEKIRIGEAGSLLNLGMYYEGLHQPAAFTKDITHLFRFTGQDDALQLQVDYQYCNDDQQDIIPIFADYFVRLLGLMTQHASQPVNTLPAMMKDEMDRVLYQFNTSPIPADVSISVVTLFEQQVEASPGARAVLFNNKELTYGELNEKANSLAHYLRDVCKVQPNDFVGIKLERSEWIVIGILGILKSGAAYVPIDTSYPGERIEYILNDSGCKAFLTEAAFTAEIAACWKGNIIEISQAASGNLSNPAAGIEPGHAMYAMYTSGSTGKPKGVIQTHACITNLLQWQLNSGDFAQGLRLVSWSSISFDVSIHEILTALLDGGEIHIVPDEVRTDPEELASYIQANGIEIFWHAASSLNMLFEITMDSWQNGHSLKHIISTGEQLKIGAGLKRFLKANPHVSLHNFYGPTETHVITSHKVVNPEQVYQPVGRPISNSQMYILDEAMQPLPMGVEGDVYMAGECLFTGYLNNKELTDDKLIANPFGPGALMYRSGDRARWLSGGIIQYLGRRDHMVKIRGFRVELGEIESQLLCHPAISEAVAAVRTGADELPYLAAYIVEKHKVDNDALRDHLGRSLPPFMVPAHYVRVESLPLTPTGKVDRKALPDVPVAVQETVFEEPSTPMEKSIARIWEEVLGKTGIGATDNFFYLGGHSLKAAQISSRIHKELNAKVSLKTIFTHPTIRLLANEIENICWLKQGANAAPRAEMEEILI